MLKGKTPFILLSEKLEVRQKRKERSVMISRKTLVGDREWPAVTVQIVHQRESV